MGTNCFLVSAGISWKKIHAYLNEEVRDQRSEERSNGNINVLGEDNALRLDDEKVDKLLDIVQETLQGRLGDSEVLARPELGCDTLSKSGLSSDLCRSSTAKHDPSRLEDVADDVEVTGGEDEDDSGGERNTGCAGVLPAQEAVEHAVVVGEVLAGSGLLLRDLLRVGKVCELIARLGSLCLCLLGDGSVENCLLCVLHRGVVLDRSHGVLC
jgi:hypothetical protein